MRKRLDRSAVSAASNRRDERMRVRIQRQRSFICIAVCNAFLVCAMSIAAQGLPEAPRAKPAAQQNHKPTKLTWALVAAQTYDGAATVRWAQNCYKTHEWNPVSRALIGACPSAWRMLLVGTAEAISVDWLPRRWRKPAKIALIAGHLAAGTQSWRQ